MSDDTRKVKITNPIKGTWWWMMGFLFTLGYLGPSTLETTGNIFKDVFAIVGAYVLWPLILGASLGGHLP